MCGLIAYFPTVAPLPTEHLARALNRMRPRGPDDEGLCHDEGVSLGHRRLAILDLDRRSAQPMHSACGRYVAVLNGEIYNFAALRAELQRKGFIFRNTSNTEVLLALFAQEGEAMLPKLHGMFAFIIWDKIARRAFAARDPYGIKPLYVARASHGVLLGSQIKALLATGLVSHEPGLRGQAGFWLLGSVPEPHTWYRDIRALPAGHCAWIEDSQMTEPRCWFDIGAVWRTTPECRLADAEIRATTRAALSETVTRHLVADVPVAATLAAHYGIRHHVRRATREEFLADLPRILDAMDQPSIDGINAWYASKAAAERGFKVVVSGVGGDELFQGYESFRQLPRVVAWRRRLGRIPGATAALALAGRAQARRSGNVRWKHATDWSRTIAGAWWLRRSVHAPEDLPRLMGREQAEVALRDFDAVRWVEAMSGPLPNDPTLALGQIESTTYLRNQLLRDSDWASMDHSVELRTPLVDAHLLTQLQPLLSAFARYPGKTLLAQAPGKALPREIAGRKKTGFAIPVGRWMAGASVDIEGISSRGWAREVVRAYRDLTGTHAQHSIASISVS